MKSRFVCGFLKISGAFLIAMSMACSGSDVKEAIDVAQGVDRKPIDASRLGVNAFFNDSRFGSPASQAAEIQTQLKLNRVRILIHWNDGVQSGPSAAINFGFYDSIIESIPGSIEVMAVVTGAPGWMSNPANWINGNPRTTFVEKFFKKVTKRYAGRGNIRAWQVWNEPNNPANSENSIMGVLDNPVNYVEMLALARNFSEGKLILNAATTAINQNYPETLDYNRGMRDAGAVSFVDVWAIHYYGKQFENVIRSNGVRDFLNGIGRPVWVTESGAQGVNSQLAYGEQVWPFLIEKIPAIERIYIYQFVEATPPDVTYGLRNLTPGSTLSDLYIHLRDR